MRPSLHRQMRYLCTALAAIAIMVTMLSTTADAADFVGCGWITGYSPATATGTGKLSLEGQTIGTFTIPAGTTGQAAGYVCISFTKDLSGPTLTGFLTPGAPGYISEPATRNPVVCGTLAANTLTSGAGSGESLFEVRSATGDVVQRVGWPAALVRPALGTYVCLQVLPGAPASSVISLVRPGEPGYIASTLPGTAAEGTPVRVCGAMSEYRAATAVGPGAIVVAEERFAISSDARVTIAAGAVVPQRVCMEGTWVRSDTVGRLLTQLTVRFCPEHSSNFPPGEGCSDVGGVLPSTSTADDRAAGHGLLIAVIGAVLLLPALRRLFAIHQR